MVDLPADTTYRLSLQWTEVHSRSYFFQYGGADLYARPLIDFTLVVLRQRDPQGKTTGADDFEVVARSDLPAQRLDNFPDSSTYRLFAEWTPDKPGRYALRIERKRPTLWKLVITNPQSGSLALIQETDRVPTGTRPLDVPTLPQLEQHGELRPRLFVEAVAGKESRLGRPVFRDFATAEGSIGIPADGQSLIATGAADVTTGKAQPYSSPGPPANLALFRTPQILAFDRVGPGDTASGPAYGSSRATAFAAGAAASMISSGLSPRELWQTLHQKKGELMQAR